MMKSIDDACRGDLILIAETYREARGIALSTVSRKFHGNQAFLSNFAAGDGTITLKTLGEMVQKFSDDWPPKLKWPAVTVLKRPEKKRGQSSTQQ